MTVHAHVGCYTTASPTGIHTFAVADDGAMSGLGGLDTVEQASFLAAHPGSATLYAVRETVDSGAIVALRAAGGTLEPIGEVPSHGSAPCHLSATADHVYVANYVSGTIAGYALRPDGTIGESVGHHRHTGSGPHARQEAPHAHCIVPAPDGASVYATDLGTDRIVRYVHDPDGLRRAGETVMAPGSGPRHLAFHPRHPVAFALCELDCTLVVLDVDDGTLHPRVAVSTLPADVDGGSIAAEVAIHPDGHRIHVSNRGHDSIATFSFDAADATPELLTHVPSGGRTPRHFAIHPAGHLLFAANQDSDNVVAFELDDVTGTPQQIGVVAEVSQPVCITFVEVEE